MTVEESRILWFVLITSFIEVHCFPTYHTQQIQSFQPRSSSLNSKPERRDPGGRYNGRNENNSEMQKRLESSLSNLFDMSRGSSSKSDVQAPSPQAEFDEELKLGFETLGFSKDDDAPILSEDVYLNSEKYFDEDGSFRGSQNSNNEGMQELALKIMNDNPTLPEEESLNAQSKEELDGIISDESLLQSMSQAKENALDSEEIHKLIFENEKGFLEQTDQFRESLLFEDGKKDEGKAREAAALRRGAQYRKDQTESMSKLLKDMEDFEKDISAKEEARQLATQQTKEIEAGSINDRNDSNRNLIACSRCKCLLSPEEIIFERKRGRSNEMTCRLCQVEERRSKHGSPYLMGRYDKNNSPPSKGYIEPPQSKALKRRIQEIRKIGPLNENVNYDMFVRDDDTPTMFELDKRTVKDSKAWREQFTSAMMRGKRKQVESPLNKTIPSKNPQDGKKATEKLANIPEQIPVSKIPRTPLDKGVYSQSNAKKDHNKYAKRLQDLRTKDRMFRSKEIYEAHLKSALYRQRAIEYTGVYSKQTPLTENTSSKETAVPTMIKESDEARKLQMMTARTKKVIQTKDAEIDQLKKEVESLKSTLNDYKGQIDKTSKKMKALQSMNAVLQKNMNKRIKKSSTNNSKIEEEGISMRNEVGEGVFRMMQPRSLTENGNAGSKLGSNQKTKSFSDEDDLLTN